MSSVALQTYNEARIESWYTKFDWKQLRVSGLILFYLSVKKAGTVCKNCDEPINFIDRVSKSVVLFCHAVFVLEAQCSFFLSLSRIYILKSD